MPHPAPVGGVGGPPDVVGARPSRPRRRRSVLAVVLVLLAVAFAWAVRAGEPKLEPTAGVDGLQVPWADPAPGDFVDEVTHPWLPLRRGAVWELATGTGAVEVRIEVAPEPVEVAGIPTTAVQVGGAVSYVAQDQDGNVWLLGEDSGRLPGTATLEGGGGSWSVADGYPAGLVLPADLRRGDGYALVAQPDGTVLGRVQIDEREQEPEVTPAGTFHEAWALQVSSVPQQEGEYPQVRRVVLAKGVGPVRISSITDGLLRLESVALP